MMKINSLVLKTIFLYIISAIMIIISMPAFFNVPFLNFVALVPAILGLRMYKNERLLILFFGLVYTSIAYSWYKDIFSHIWGYFLIVAVAFWHSGLIIRGIKFESKLPKNFQIFSLPLIYSLLEFVQRNMPYVKQWWFIPYPKTSWGFPQSLWLLSVTGITGVTFLMILSNSTIAKIIQNALEKKKNSKILFFNMILVILYLIYGFYYVGQDSSEKSYNIAVVSDMANDISRYENEGLYVDDEKVSNLILQENLKLSENVSEKADFIVWSENEFFDFDDENKIKILQNWAKKTNTFLVVDSYMNRKSLYDTAVMIAPNDTVGGVSKKKYLFEDEIKAGFVPSEDKAQSFLADNVKVGLGVCYDFHFVDVVRDLAKDGAKIILMPRDDDMKRNKFFPYYHSTDAVFRAIENSVVVASANTNGASIVVDYTGKIKAYSPVNETSSVIGKVSKSNSQTIYTRFGEWFAFLLIFSFVIIVFRNMRKVD